MRIVMDDAGDLPAEMIEKYDIQVIPINVTFGTEEFLTGISMDHQAFYQKVKEVGEHNFPKSSQPTPYQFVELFKEILAGGEKDILTITVGQKLSGTYDSAEAAGQELAGQGNFYLFDSAAGSAAQGYMVLEAARLLQGGAGVQEILARLEEIREKQLIAFLINSLEYAVKGGRIGSLQSMVASVLRIKPIMQLKDGAIVEAGRVRTYNKALDYIVDYMVERVGHNPVKVAFIHAGDPEGAELLRQRSQSKLSATEDFTTDMGISVAINLGPGALGIVVIPE
jgi:DegV family protein with EDD domain